MKDLIDNTLVDRFCRAENQLLQVLLTKFTLRRTQTGVCLHVAFDEETPAVWLRDGKTEVQKWREETKDYSHNVRHYQAKLDDFFDGNGGSEYVFNAATFPFRYVSGGTLPVIRMGGTEYYALFYRDVFPIGWNLSNGGSDTREELLQPVETIERELREELMVVAAKHKARYVFATEAGKTLERSEYAVARRLWEKKFTAGGYPDFGRWNELIIPLKWMPAPDSLEVSLTGAEVERTSDCYISITTEDFGIEVDRVAKMTVDQDSTLLDGEVHGSRLLNRPVGLFEVDKLNAAVETDQNCFLPDRYFFGVPQPSSEESYFNGNQWLGCGAPSLLEDVKSWRSPQQIQNFIECKKKLDLCPVTKRMIRRLVQQIKREVRGSLSTTPVSEVDSEVFISYGRGDQQFAEAVFRYVRNDLGKKAFFSAEGVRHSHFRREIENALVRSHYFISVGSSIGNLRREWPTYECQVFHNEILNGNKSGSAQIISFITGLDPRHLPLPQRLFEAIVFDPMNLAPALARLPKYLQAAK